MSIRNLLKIIPFVAVALVFVGQAANASVPADWNQNNIIDENLFLATGSMSQTDIQNFLNSTGGFLANWTDSVDMYSQFTYHNDPTDPNSATSTTAPCLVHVHTGMTAAQIIYQAATNWNPYYNQGWSRQFWWTGAYDANGNKIKKQEINACLTTPDNGSGTGYNLHDPQPNPVITTISPKVILSTLQKEQSLLTATGTYSQNPSDYTNATYPASGNQYALSWAMGYGVPDSGGKDGTKRGLYQQVMYAAWQLRLDNQCAVGDTYQWPGFEGGSYCGGKYIVGQSRVIDGTTVTPQNGATDALYNYTPHFAGNQSFVTIYERYFGSVHPPSYKFVSAVNPPSTMQPGQTVTVSVILKNTGTQIWWNDDNATGANADPAGGGAPTPMRLYTTQPADHNNPFGGGTGWVGQNRMTMLSGKVSPGDSGLFQFSYTAPLAPGTYLEHFAPTIENVVKLEDVGMAFLVNVPKVYTYSFVSATNPPSIMMPGQTATTSVVLKNTGNVTWGNESSQPTSPTRLFTTRPNDHPDAFGGGNGWIGKNRMILVDSSVAPGANGTFTFDYTAPSTPGTYEDFFAPTIENVTKMADTGMEFKVTVPPAYGYQFVSATNPPRYMSPGQTATVSVVLRNTGSTVWRNDTSGSLQPTRLFTTRPNDHNDLLGGGAGWIGQNRMVMQDDNVGYGQTATYTFAYTAPNTKGTYDDFFSCTIENVIKLPDVGMELLVTVQ